MIQSMEILHMALPALQERIEQELESNIALETLEPGLELEEQHLELGVAELLEPGHVRGVHDLGPAPLHLGDRVVEEPVAVWMEAGHVARHADARAAHAVELGVARVAALVRELAQ